jgi:phosphatidylinositol alpha-1,6-mannosyltransferase
MNSLLVSEVFPPQTGGSGRWFWELYRRLSRERFLIAAGTDPRQEAFDRTHHLRLVRVPLRFPTWGLASARGLWHYGRAARTLGALVRAGRIDRLHAGKCLPEGLLALGIKCRWGVPYAVYVHGEELNLAGTSRELRWLTRRVLRGAGLVIANSRNTEGLLRQAWGVPAPRLCLLHPGADTGRFVPAARDRGARGRLGWGERPVLLTVGRLQKRKGHDQMVRALDAVRRVLPDVLYAVVGDGEERAALAALVERQRLGDHVQFLGELDDSRLVQCYQQCDLFVLPNRQVGGDFEGFGMVLVEAQACGKPVVAGASGGTAETMSIPETGQVVSCDGPDELAAVVTGLLADAGRRARMGRAARDWAVAHFDWAVLARQAERLFAGAWPSFGGGSQTRAGLRPAAKQFN